MSEALRAHCSTFHLLDVIVADSSSCPQARGDVFIVNKLSLLTSVRPYARETVGLQLEIDGESVLLPRILTGEVLHLLLDPENVLHMVAEFVRNDVGLCKLGVGAAKTPQFIPEAEVDVDLFVRRAVKRSGLRLRHSTGGTGVVIKKYQLRAPIVSVSLLGQESRPCSLHIVEDKRD